MKARPKSATVSPSTSSIRGSGGSGRRLQNISSASSLNSSVSKLSPSSSLTSPSPTGKNNENNSSYSPLSNTLSPSSSFSLSSHSEKKESPTNKSHLVRPATAKSYIRRDGSNISSASLRNTTIAINTRKNNLTGSSSSSSSSISLTRTQEKKISLLHRRPSNRENLKSKTNLKNEMVPEQINESGIISIAIGDVGANLMVHTFEQLCREHSLDMESGKSYHPSGRKSMVAPSSELGISNFFCSFRDGTCKPRCLFVDSNDFAKHRIMNSTLKNMYNFQPLFQIKPIDESQYPLCYNLLFSLVFSNVEYGDFIRKEMEKCSKFQGFLTFHSLGGSTGSGASIAALGALPDSGKYPIIDFGVFPSPRNWSGTYESWNAMKCIDGLTEKLKGNGAICILDNHKFIDLCRNLKVEASFRNINSLMAHVVSLSISPLRYKKSQNTIGSLGDIVKLMTENTPSPLLHSSFIPISETYLVSADSIATKIMNSHCMIRRDIAETGPLTHEASIQQQPFFGKNHTTNQGTFRNETPVAERKPLYFSSFVFSRGRGIDETYLDYVGYHMQQKSKKFGTFNRFLVSEETLHTNSAFPLFKREMCMIGSSSEICGLLRAMKRNCQFMCQGTDSVSAKTEQNISEIINQFEGYNV